MPTTTSWTELPTLTGELIRLEPLRSEHAAGYLEAVGTGESAQEVFRWLSMYPPTTLAEARQQIEEGIDSPVRRPFVQLDAQTGEVAGTTSYYEISPATRSLAIGHTWLGQRWWRSGHNTESKLLLLTYAFETLGAVRMVWHTDIYNERSQAAIARLGATREGELRKHRVRRDGSWRTTVQYSMTDDDWPAARDHLSARLGRG
ncbi:GNAT family protein [Jatrophihabitans sp.]|uniref:GNAT family N-acetyltransferase n=1 Tax=Jatrophihabitans sp. TaxID=1932789 RepID=UPI0030C6F76A|nr:N-acetyltransferase [Jatrophihabitans sp.]